MNHHSDEPSHESADQAAHPITKSIDGDTSRQLKHEVIAYSWPGNVRELENVVERELIRTREGLLRFEEIGATTTPRDQPGVERRGPIRLDEAMAAHIESVLASTGGKIHGPGGAAELLGMNENTLRNRMDRLRIVFRRRARTSRRGGA